MSNGELVIRGEGAPQQALNILDTKTFQGLMEVANFFAKSDLIPKHFQGKPANIFIALELSARMQMSPFMVMQSLYIVYGRPGFEGKFSVALVNSSQLFTMPLQYRFEGDGDNYGCTAWTQDKAGNVIEGPKVTWAMVKAEGWDQPKKRTDGQGTIPSKWKTMPDMMFRYRAGAYFAKTVCPQVIMGMPTVEEIEDATYDLPLMSAPEQPTEDPNAWPSDEELEAMGIEVTSMVRDFVELTTKTLGATIRAVLQGAVEDPDGFKKAFEAWQAKQTKGKSKGTKKEAATTPQEAQGGNSEPGPEPQTPKVNGDIPKKVITQDQMHAITKLCERARVDVLGAIIPYGVTKLEELTQADAAALIGQLNNTILQKNKAPTAITEAQVSMMYDLCSAADLAVLEVIGPYHVTTVEELTQADAATIIGDLNEMIAREKEK